MRELKFKKAVRDLLNTRIGLFLSNHHYMEGNLLAVKQDHLVIDVDQNVHYIPLQQIKTLSKNTKDYNTTSSIVPYLNIRYFTEILNVMKYSWVTINGSDKDAQYGVLSKIADDYIIIINQKELLYIPTTYISNIHGVLSEQQIRLANENEKQTIQLAHQTTTNAEVETIETHLPDVIEEPASYELLLEKVPQKAELEEVLQTVENGNHDQLGSTKQIEILMFHGVVNQGEDINVDSSQSSTSPEGKLVIQDETQLVSPEENLDIEDDKVIVLSEISPTIQDEETLVVSEINPEIQEEELVAVSVATPKIQEQEPIAVSEIQEEELVTVSVASQEIQEVELIAVSVSSSEIQEEELIAVSVASQEIQEVEPIAVSEIREEELVAVSVASPEIQEEELIAVSVSSQEIQEEEPIAVSVASPEIQEEELVAVSVASQEIQEQEPIAVSEIQEEEPIAVSVASPEIQEEELIAVSLASPEIQEEELVTVSVPSQEIQEEMIAVSVSSPEIQEEELIAVSVSSPEIQEELFVEEIESIQMEKTLGGLETDSPEEVTHRVPNLLDYDEDESDVWGILETTFNSRTIDSFSFDEPLGYERDFPISFWKTREQDQQTITNDNNVAQEEESFAHSIQLQDLQDASKPVEFLDTPIVELLSKEDAVNDNYDSIIDEEVQPSKSNNASITIIRISMKDKKEILEEQYFSLAKHAANYTQSNRRKNPVESAPIADEAFDGQYISLMNHAAKMYRQLLDK